MADPIQHLTAPHLATHEDAQAYETLLAALRKDLLLDPSIDMLPPGIVSAQALPWKIDKGTATCTFTAASTTPVVTTPHGLSRPPVVVLMQLTAAGALVNFIGSVITGKNAANFTWNGWYGPGGATTGAAVFDWVAIG